MKIFVTGGTGFVGSHVVEELSKKGHTVLILSRGKHASTRTVRYLRGDLSTLATWKKQLNKFKPAAAIHMAWEGIPDYGPENSVRNLSYGVALMRALAGAHCKKVVVTGSCWEYGTLQGALKEDDAVRILNPFSATKLALAKMGEVVARESNMAFVWARIFYVYGPGQKSISLIPHLIARKRAGLLPEIKNPNGGNDFVYVGDVARAIRLLTEKRTKTSLYNIGAGKLTGVREIANVIYGKKIIPGRGKPSGFYADITRIKKEFGWRPKVGIQEGIRKMETSK